MSSSDEASHSDESWWRSTWPLGTHEWKELGVGFVLVVAVFTALGFALTEVFAPNPLTGFDADLAEEIVDHRTERGDEWSHRASMMSNTMTKIVATTLLVVAALAKWRRWHDGLLIAVSLIFEASAYVVVSRVVARPRPDVPKLIDSPIATSFPSGHVAAATVYLSLAVVVAWHTRSRIARYGTTFVAAVVAMVVAFARMYQGMHFLTDIIGGIALGLVTIVITTRVIERSRRAPRAEHPPRGAPNDSKPPETSSLPG